RKNSANVEPPPPSHWARSWRSSRGCRSTFGCESPLDASRPKTNNSSLDRVRPGSASVENKAIPAILDEEAHQRFESLFREHGWQADHRFSGGYVEHVWANARPLIEAFAGPLGSKRVLEFGCNYGASAIVLSHLGAVVTAVDVDANFLQIAQ